MKFIRIVLVLLLVQFLAPAFMPFAEAEANDKATVCQSHNDSVQFPALLLESEEKEWESQQRMLELTLIPLIDFDTLSLTLTRFHTIRLTAYPIPGRVDYLPPVYLLNCIYRI